MAQLQINYTPQYTGCHRICLVGEEETCCYIDSSLSIVGVSKEVIIDLADYPCIVPPTEEIDCQGYSLTGYIQPCCTDEDSLLNRVSFTAAWPVTLCVQYQLECTASGQCLPFTFTDCSGQSTGPLQGTWNPGLPAIVCSINGAPSNPSNQYIITQVTPGTCCNCRSYTVTNVNEVPMSIYYAGCDYVFVDTPLILDPLEEQTFCAIENTIFTVTQNAFVGAEDNGPCIS